MPSGPGRQAEQTPFQVLGLGGELTDPGGDRWFIAGAWSVAGELGDSFLGAGIVE